MPTVKYAGQPEAAIGFLVEVWEPWTKLVAGDEWGDLVDALLGAAELSESASDHELTLYLCTKIQDELVRAHDEGFWDDYVEHRHAKEILNAQALFEPTVASWRRQVKGFNGNTPETSSVATDRLEELIAGLPEWIKPQEVHNLLRLELAILQEDNRVAHREIDKRKVRIEEIKGQLKEN